MEKDLYPPSQTSLRLPALYKTFLSRYHRTTTRLVAAVITAFRKLQSAKEVAIQFNLSSTTALRYFDLVEYRCVKLPQVLSIDEFKGNAGGEKYQCILTDTAERKVLDIPQIVLTQP